ncbi:MAG: hypothetical protein GTN70_09905, partial [Deltaproteobacteria bacterium]|nr:hypothetical protein [Deltaproteobacteria bacterium]
MGNEREERELLPHEKAAGGLSLNDVLAEQETPFKYDDRDKERAFDSALEFPLTEDFRAGDTYNANLFVNQHGAHIRWCEPFRKFYVWNEKRWEPDAKKKISEFAQKTIRELYSEAKNCEDSDQRRELARHAVKSDYKHRIDAMIELAKPKIAILPEELDKDPWLLNCENGTLDLRTLEINYGRREHFITKIVPARYKQGAPAPTWYSFLNDVTNRDVELQRYLQRSVGYALTGLIREHVLFFLYGSGRNGKSTFLNAII